MVAIAMGMIATTAAQVGLGNVKTGRLKMESVVMVSKEIKEGPLV